MRRMLLIALALAMLAGTGAAARADRSITVYNWYDYIDEDVIGMFEEETGISVKYVNFTGNEEMYVTISRSSSAYDVIVPSDYIIERMIREDMLEELDFALMPNAAGVLDWLKSPDYDPAGAYSVPYMWGTVGILYDPDMVGGEIDSWEALFDPANKRDVFMLDSIRDTIGVTLKMLGYSMNTRDAAELSEAKDRLLGQKADGIVKGYLVDETKDKMISGEAAIALMWSGDALYSMSENESLVYVVPKEGSNVWVDALCVPKGCRDKEAAMAFIDFLCRPDIARMNLDEICYSTPIQAVVDEMDEDERGNLALNPTPDILERCEFFHDISDAMALYDEIWMEIRS